MRPYFDDVITMTELRGHVALKDSHSQYSRGAPEGDKNRLMNAKPILAIRALAMGKR